MRWTLSVKLALGIAVIMTAAMGSALLLLTINTRNMMMEGYIHSAIQLSDVADASLENAMISRKSGEITNIMQAIGLREGIVGGVIFDRRGEIKYSIECLQRTGSPLGGEDRGTDCRGDRQWRAFRKS